MPTLTPLSIIVSALPPEYVAGVPEGGSMSVDDLPPSYGPVIQIPANIEWMFPTLAGADTQGPEVIYKYPEEGGTLHEFDPIMLDVVDETSNLRRVLLAARFASTGIEELVFDGDRFVGQYCPMSSREVAENGYAFVLLRRGGWLGNTTVTVRAWAEDAAGNVEEPPEEEE